MVANSELEVLTARNNELKNQLTTLQDEINRTKDELSRKRILKIDKQMI